MSLCAICGKLLANSESGRRPCCQARVHSKCILGYADYCHSSGNPNPSCPVCKQQAEDLRSKSANKGSILSNLRKSSNNSISSADGPVMSDIHKTSQTIVSPKSPHVAQAEALILKAEQRSAEKERQVADAELQVAEELERLSRRDKIAAEKRSERSRSPNASSQTTSAFKKTIATLEKKVTELISEATQKQFEFDKRLLHEVSKRKELESKFNALADYSAQLQSKEEELSTQLELKQDEYAAVKSSLSTAESKLLLLNEHFKNLQEQNSANEALLSSNQGISQQVEKNYQQQVSYLSESLSAAQTSLEEAGAEQRRLQYYENKCAELEASNNALLQSLSLLEQKENLMQSSHSDLNSQIVRLKDEYSDLQSELADSRQDVMMMRDSHIDLESQLKNVEKSKEQLESLNKHLNKELQDIQERLREALSAAQNANDNSSHDNARILQLESSLIKVQEQYKIKCSELSKINVQMEGIEEAKSQQDIEFEQLHLELNSLKETLQSSENMYNEAAESQSRLQGQLNAVRKRCSELESISTEVDTLREENQRLDSIVSAVQTSFAESKNQVSQLLHDKSEFQSKVQVLLENENSYQEELLRMKGALQDSKQTIDLVSARKSELEETVSEMADSLLKLEEKYRGVILANDKLEQRLDEFDSLKQKAEESWNDECDELKEQVRNATAQLEEISFLKESLKAQFSDAESELQQAKMSLENKVASISESLQNSEIERLAAIDELEKVRTLHQSELQFLQDSVEDLKVELQKSQDQLEQSENKNTLLQEMLENLKDSMESAHNLTKKDVADAEMMNTSLSEKIEILQDQIAEMTTKILVDRDHFKSSINISSDKLEECLQTLTLNELQLREAEDQISQLNSALDDACAKFYNSDSVIAERSEECDRLKSQLSDLAGRFSDLLSDHDNISQDNTRLLHMFERSDEECQALKEQLSLENKRQSHISEMFLRSINAQKVEFLSVQEELIEVKALLAKTLEERAVMSQQARSFEELFPILESQRSSMSKLQNDHSRVCALLEAMEDSKSDLAQQIEVANEQLKQKTGDFELLVAENSTLKSTIAELKQQAENDCKEVAALHHQLTQTESERAELFELTQMQLQSSLSGPVMSQLPRDVSPALNRESKTNRIKAEPSAGLSNMGLNSRSSSKPASMKSSRDPSPALSRASTAPQNTVERIEELSTVALQATVSDNSRPVSTKPSRDPSPALNRASTAVRNNVKCIIDSSAVGLSIDPILGRVVSNADSESSHPTGHPVDVLDREALSSRSDSDKDSVLPDFDVENSSAAQSDHSMLSSRKPSPSSNHLSSQPDSPRSGAAPELLAPIPPSVGRPSGPVPPSRAPARPFPMIRRMGPPIRRIPVSSRLIDQKPTGVSTSPRVDVETSLGISSPEDPVVQQKSAPTRPVPAAQRPLRAPGRPVPFRPQALRRGPIPPNRAPVPTVPVTSDAAISMPIAAAPSQSDPSLSPVISPRSTQHSRQTSASNIDSIDVVPSVTPNKTPASTSSRPESPDSAKTVPMVNPSSSIRTAAPPPTAHLRPMSSIAPSRSGPPGRPGGIPSGPPRTVIRPSPAPAKSSDSATAPIAVTAVPADNEDESKLKGERDNRPVPAAEPARRVPIRPGATRSGPMANRRPGPPLGRRPPIAPSRGSSYLAPEPLAHRTGPRASSSAAIGVSTASKSNRSRSASPKPPSTSSSPRHLANEPVKHESAQASPARALSHQPMPLRSRDSTSDAVPRSKSLLQKLLSSGSDDGEVEKVEFVFERRSQTWVPEGSLPPVVDEPPNDDSAASNALNTVQRLRSQVHQTREQISNVNADLPESKPLPVDQPSIPEEKWIQACELLRESRLRLAKDDALRLRIEAFLADAGSGGLPLPDAVSELEELLQTVQTHDEETKRGCCSQLLTTMMILSVIVAIVGTVLYAFYPQESMQTFDMLQAFVIKSWASWTRTNRASDLDIDDFDETDRTEL